jgi:hypothetical protein
MAFFDQYRAIDRKAVAATDKNDIKARLLAAIQNPQTKDPAAKIIKALLDFKVAQKNGNATNAELKLTTLHTNIQKLNALAERGVPQLTFDELQKFVRNSSALFQRALPSTFKSLLEGVLRDVQVRSRLVDTSTAALLRDNGLITADDARSAIPACSQDRPTLAEVNRWLSGWVDKNRATLQLSHSATLTKFVNQTCQDIPRLKADGDRCLFFSKAEEHVIAALKAMYGSDSRYALRTPTSNNFAPSGMRGAYVRTGRLQDRAARAGRGPENDAAKKARINATGEAMFGEKYEPERINSQFSLPGVETLWRTLVPEESGDRFVFSPEQRWNIREGAPRSSVALANGQPYLGQEEPCMPPSRIDDRSMAASLLVFFSCNQMAYRHGIAGLNAFISSFTRATENHILEAYEAQNVGQHLPGGFDDLFHMVVDIQGMYGGSCAPIRFYPGSAEAELFFCGKILWLPVSKRAEGVEYNVESPMAQQANRSHSFWWVVVRTNVRFAWNFQSNFIVVTGRPELRLFNEEVLEQAQLPPLRP